MNVLVAIYKPFGEVFHRLTNLDNLKATGAILFNLLWLAFLAAVVYAVVIGVQTLV
jgi:hypothetical protein